MKYQMCKIQEILIFERTEIVELDPTAFRNLKKNPYIGNSEQEFLNYISILSKDFEPPDDLDSNVADELGKIIGYDSDDVNWTKLSSSQENGDKYWIQIGEKNKEYYGGFKVNREIQTSDC